MPLGFGQTANYVVTLFCSCGRKPDLHGFQERLKTLESFTNVQPLPNDSLHFESLALLAVPRKSDGDEIDMESLHIAVHMTNDFAISDISGLVAGTVQFLFHVAQIEYQRFQG